MSVNVLAVGDRVRFPNHPVAGPGGYRLETLEGRVVQVHPDVRVKIEGEGWEYCDPQRFDFALAQQHRV